MKIANKQKKSHLPILKFYFNDHARLAHFTHLHFFCNKINNLKMRIPEKWGAFFAHFFSLFTTLIVFIL